MYNGIGLQTARGSGTNGYVQRNLALLSAFKRDVKYKTDLENQRTQADIIKPPSREIEEHERKRKIEVKCFEMEELMQEQGYTDEEIAQKVSLFKAVLTEQDRKLHDSLLTESRLDDSEKRSSRPTNTKAEMMRQAMRLDSKADSHSSKPITSGSTSVATENISITSSVAVSLADRDKETKAGSSERHGATKRTKKSHHIDSDTATAESACGGRDKSKKQKTSHK